MLLKDKHIFIVEDNLQNRVIFQIGLVRQGAIVEFERWGRNTIHQLQRMNQVDLIILDLMLADGMSGFDLYDEIRTMPKLASVPVIAVSAMDPSIAIPQVRARGFAGFIAKPIDNHEFPKQLASIIDGERVWYTGSTTLS